MKIAAQGSVSVEVDGKCHCCSVVGNALGNCQLVADATPDAGIYIRSESSILGFVTYIVPYQRALSYLLLFKLCPHGL